MPPKARISRDLIVQAAFETARQEGIERVNARTISGKLHCSTQPVLYYFTAIEEIRQAVCQKAADFYRVFLERAADWAADSDRTETASPAGSALAAGLAHVRFAAAEPQLFRLLFQNSEGEKWAAGCFPDSARTEGGFEAGFLAAHGLAGLIASHFTEYEEEKARQLLEEAFCGDVPEGKEKTKEKLRESLPDFLL